MKNVFNCIVKIICLYYTQSKYPLELLVPLKCATYSHRYFFNGLVKTSEWKPNHAIIAFSIAPMIVTTIKI